MGAPPARAGAGFGLDAYGIDDRLRLFHFAAQPNRLTYLTILRGFARAKAAYRVRLSPLEVAELIAGQADDLDDNGNPTSDLSLINALDNLTMWGNLDKSQDGARAATVREYRQRMSVYGFTEGGYLAYTAVEKVLSESIDEAKLSRLVFADLLEDLHGLVEANRIGDGEAVHRRLSRLDEALASMAARASRFYLMLGDLARTQDVRPQVFLSHKDALLTHLRDFQSGLRRYTPLLQEAIATVEATGVDQLVDLAARHDERIFRSYEARRQDWRFRWNGLVGWFRDTATSSSDATQLQVATVSAIRDIVSLLRRITEARRGGVSRDSELRHLAAWFTACPDEGGAHALFSAAFNMRQIRHVTIPHPDPELIRPGQSWWDAPSVPVSKSVVERGKHGSPGRPAAVDRNDAARRHLHAEQVAAHEAGRAAALSILEKGVTGRILDEAETQLLKTLLDRALAGRQVVAGQTEGGAGASDGVRMELRPAPGTRTVVTTKGGRLVLDGLVLTVGPATGAALRRPGKRAAASGPASGPDREAS